jgi:hypothetical protein
MSRPGRALRPSLAALDCRCLLSTTTGLSPSQITAAYGLTGLEFHTRSGQAVIGDGSGETIAVIEMYHNPNLSSDLHTFDRRFGLSDPPLDVINQAGNQVDSSWGQEESLDVEWAHAIAPGARIIVVEAAPGYTNDQAIQSLMTAVQTADQTPGVTVVSMSWGFNEFPGETQYDSYFNTPGITYVAASGDTANVDYPAASPYVLSVGGTTLNISGSGGYGSESSWYDSGGGYSLYEAEPAYQMSLQSTGQRSTPDVAFDGDPNTGVQVYFTPPAGNGFGRATQSQGSWNTFGGTSLGAPAWAGIIAIADQGRLQTGLPSLSGSDQTIPSLYALAGSDFHAVTATSVNAPWTGGGFAGWGGFGEWGGFFGWGGFGDQDSGTPGGGTTSGSANTQTGLGTPVGSALISGLSASQTTAPLYPAAPTPSPTPSPSPTSTPTPTPIPMPGRHGRRHGRLPHETGKANLHGAAPHKQAAKHLKPSDRIHSGGLDLAARR